MAITNRAEANSVWSPKSWMASGQMAGHMIACAKLRQMIARMEAIPCVHKATITSTTDRHNWIINALRCEMTFGTNKMPHT